MQSNINNFTNQVQPQHFKINIYCKIIDKVNENTCVFCHNYLV